MKREGTDVAKQKNLRLLVFNPALSTGQNAQFETKKVLVYIRSLKLKVDENKIDYLIKHGVIGQRQVRGKGRARSVIGCWSLAQRELLREALTLEQQYGADLVDLCLLPIAKWLYWGEPSDVSLEQVKRAMRTWADYHRRRAQRSFKRAQQDAHQLARTVGHQDAVEKRQLEERLANMLYNWDHSEEELYDYLKPLIDPDQKGEAKGPQGARLSPEAVSHLIIARTTAIDAIACDKQIPDSLWEWARAFYLFTFQQYEQQRPIFAAQTADTTVAHLFQANDLSSLYSMACFELATVLGVGLLNPAPLHLPIHLQPQTWEKQKMTACVTSRPIPSPLLGPDGRPLMHLQVEVSLNLLNEGENRTDWQS